MYKRQDDRVCLRFSPEAQERWITFYNQAEGLIGVFGHFDDVKDYISKLSDNLARLAALLHHFNGGGGDIPLSILENAIDVYKRQPSIPRMRRPSRPRPVLAALSVGHTDCDSY